MEKQKPVKPAKQTKAKDEPKPKQALKDQINKKAKPYVEPAKTQVMYRYFCNRCTGIAFNSPTMVLGASDKVCASCHSPMGYLTQENYIKLT